jgi:preprotein translocase subunit SecY
MNFKKNKISLINELDFYELNEEEINTFSKKADESKILTNSAKEKLLVTCFLIFLIRLGNFIEIPGIDKSAFFNLTKSNLFLPGLGSNFSGSNLLPSLFSLGIGPSINASIIMQLFLAINPELKKFQREEGEAGRRKISEYTRYLTLFLSIIQSFFFVLSLRSIFLNWTFQTAFEISCCLTTGAMIILWVSEKITKDGITNGSSLLVFLNIIANTPQQFQASLPYLNFFQLLIIVLTLITTIAGVIILQQSVRCIPIITSKISMQEIETNVSKQKTFFPVKLNQAGVMPIVFASYLLPVLKSFTLLIVDKINSSLNISIVFPKVFNQFIYFSAEFILICLFTSFYSLLIIDAKDISENLQKATFFIPGIRPGKQTLVFLENLFQRQSFLGGIILATNAVLLNLIGLVIKLPVLQGIGIGSQIIIVGVTIEVIQKIRALMISEVYKKYLKTKN